MAKSKNKKEIKFFTKGSSDYIIWIVVGLLLALGLIMVLSASSATALSESGDSYKYFKRQLVSAVIGVAGMIVLSKIDYRIYRKLKWIIYAVVVVLLVSVKFIGISAGGAKRWISIAGFNFQPSELAKLGLIIFYASLLTDIKEQDKIRSFGKGLIFPLIWLAPIILAVYVFQNHFSATFIICAVTAVQMLIAGTRLSHFAILGIVGACGLGVFLNVKNSGAGSSSFRMTRIQTWLNPWSDVTGDGWQIIQSLYAIGSGGLFGAGLGQSKQKYLYLPEPQNDFIFAVLAEELGYVGCLVVIALFLVFIWRGIVISMRAKDTFGSLIAIGITTLIGLQAIINIAVVTNTMPVTGMELPFFSYGGTALMINLFAVGILLNISRSGVKK
jgi:cell division protein FtsW